MIPNKWLLSQTIVTDRGVKKFPSESLGKAHIESEERQKSTKLEDFQVKRRLLNVNPVYFYVSEPFKASTTPSLSTYLGKKEVASIEEFAVGEMRIANVARLMNCDGNDYGVNEGQSPCILVEV